jgi:hypothetical protein
MFQFQSQSVILILSSEQEYFRTPRQRQKQGLCELLTAGSLLSERKGTVLQTLAVLGFLCLGNKLSGEKIKTIEERNVHNER